MCRAVPTRISLQHRARANSSPHTRSTGPGIPGSFRPCSFWVYPWARDALRRPHHPQRRSQSPELAVWGRAPSPVRSSKARLTVPGKRQGGILSPVTLSIVIITHNEEANLPRTLASVMPLVGDGKGEIIVVDSCSTDRTVEIARSHGAKVFVEHWKGYAAQKNSAIEKATGDWILSLDADEEVDTRLAEEIGFLILGNTRHLVSGRVPVYQKGAVASTVHGFSIRRKNHFLGRSIKH